MRTKEAEDFSHLEIQPSDGPQAPFVDVGSRFAVWQNADSKELDIDHASLAGQRNGKLSFMKPLLHLQIFDMDQVRTLAMGKKTTSWHPWGFVQEAEAEGLHLRATVTYADLDVVSVHVDVENMGESVRNVRLSFNGQVDDSVHVALDDSRHLPEIKNLNGTIISYQVSPPTNQYPMKGEPLHRFAIVTAIQPQFQLEDLETDGRFNGMSGAVTLQRHRNHAFSFLISAAARDIEHEFLREDRMAEAEELVRRRISLIQQPSSTRIALAQQRWNNLLSRLPAIPKHWKENEKKLFYHAVITLLRNTIRPQPEQGYAGSYGPHSITFPSRGFYEAGWIWDTAFHAMAFAQLGLIDFAKSNLRAMFHGQNEKTGAIHFKHPDFMVEGAQPPFFSWAVYQVYEQHPDREFLEEFYPKLKAWNNWWYANRLRTVIRDRKKTQLFGWEDNLETGWDNSPRWDYVNVKELVSPDLNAELLMDLRVLEWMAGELGRVEEVRDWKEKAETLSRNMLDVLYDSTDGLFYDVNIRDGSFRRIKTPACFFPLWTGVPLEPDQIKKAIDGWLRNAKVFFGDYPFPNVAYNESTYAPRFYWRGPIWLNLAYFMTDTLYRYGYGDEALEASHRLLDMVMRNDHIYEYYNSQSGDPGEGPSDVISEIPAAQGFSWSAAFALMLLLQKFAVFPTAHAKDDDANPAGVRIGIAKARQLLRSRA